MPASNPTLLEKAAWKVVSPPPELSGREADRLLEAWRGPRAVTLVEPLAGGIMNWNYGIRLDGSAERFVLRFYDRQPESCAKEVRILALVRDDVPVPRVWHAEIAGAHGWPPFCVLEFVDGISLRELRRQGDVAGVAEASYDAGRLLPRLGRHRFDRTGLLSADLAVTDGPFAGATLAEVIETFTSSPLFLSRVGATLHRAIGDFVRRHDAIVRETGGSLCLTHGDFNSPNIFVKRTCDRWTVAALLDWEFAFAGTPWCDIGNMLRYERPGRPRYEPHFSRGLADAGFVLPDDWFLRARLADLPALCELLARDDVPDAVVAELIDLLQATVAFA